MENTNIPKREFDPIKILLNYVQEDERFITLSEKEKTDTLSVMEKFLKRETIIENIDQAIFIMELSGRAYERFNDESKETFFLD